jgi:hypothetical protein
VKKHLAKNLLVLDLLLLLLEELVQMSHPLKIMKMDNDSGSWANPWKLSDHSGATWGQENGGF